MAERRAGKAGARPAEAQPAEARPDRAQDVPDILVRIVEQRRRRLATADVSPPASPAAAPVSGGSFLAALRRDAPRAIIAEVKMGSPKLGDLRRRVDPLAQAELYARAGASALSVVVEPDFFFGSYELLARCRAASGLPAVAKDFVVDDRQLEWARAAGASAILLIAALYDPVELERLARAARRLGLVPLVETHDRADVDRLGDGEWELVGVNNRDLRTFRVDLVQSIALRPHLPPSALAVAESGIASGADVERLVRAGYESFLVGEALLLAAEPAELLGELRG